MKRNEGKTNSSINTLYTSDALSNVLQVQDQPIHELEKPRLSLIIMLICFVSDIISFTNLLSPVLNDSKILIVVCVLGLVVAVDVAAVVLGFWYKKFSQGYNMNMLVLAVTVSAIVGGFTAYGYLRYKAKDMVLPKSSYAVNEMSAKTEEETNPLAGAVAVFMTILPILTSGVSFAVSFMASNPAQKELTKLEKEARLIRRENENYESQLHEFSQDPYTKEKAIKHEKVLCSNKIKEICERTKYEVDYSIEMLKEHLGTPEAISALSQPVYNELMKYLNDSSSDEIIERMISELELIDPDDTDDKGNPHIKVA